VIVVAIQQVHFVRPYGERDVPPASQTSNNQRHKTIWPSDGGISTLLVPIWYPSMLIFFRIAAAVAVGQEYRWQMEGQRDGTGER